MDHYKYKFLQHWMSTDEKPRGRDRQLIAKQARQHAKQSIRQQLIEDYIENDPERLINEMLNEEAEESMYCHEYGPCDRCLARSQQENEKTS